MTPAELRRARQALGMTQVDLGAALGVDRVTVTKMERGYAGWPIEPRTSLAVECLLRRAGRWPIPAAAPGPPPLPSAARDRAE